MSARTLTSIAATPEAGPFAPIPLVGPFSETFAQAAELGYDAIELHIRSPKHLGVAAIDRLLSRHDLLVSAIATGQLYLHEGISFTNPHLEMRRAAIAAINEFSRMAADLGASLILGYIRGKFGDDSELAARQRQWMLECCRECSDFAAPLGVKLLLEPINRYEMNDFNTVAAALSFAGAIDRPNFQLILDTFHMNIEEPSITSSIGKAAGCVPYFHMVDSNRWAPGFGHTDFKEIAHALRSIEFSGFLAAEMLPHPDHLTAARQAIEAYREMIAIIEA